MRTAPSALVARAGRPRHSAGAGTTLITRRPRRVPNSTLPSIRANSVSSPPRPTLVPGWKCVPRCRTMIVPALTSWPPKRFTPNRCALESRPLLDDPPPFLCAIAQSSLALLRRLDVGDLDLGVLLTVSHAASVTGLVLVFADVDLGALGVADDLGRDLDLGQLLGLGGHLAVVDQEHGRQQQRLARARVDLVDLEDIADGDLLLVATTAHDRVHRGLTLSSKGKGGASHRHPRRPPRIRTQVELGQSGSRPTTRPSPPP